MKNLLMISVALLLSCAKSPRQEPLCFGIQEANSLTILQLNLDPIANQEIYTHELIVSEFAGDKEVAPPMKIPGRIAEGRYFIMPSGSTFEYTEQDFKLAPPEKQNSYTEIKSANPSPLDGLVFLKMSCPK